MALTSKALRPFGSSKSKLPGLVSASDTSSETDSTTSDRQRHRKRSTKRQQKHRELRDRFVFDELARHERSLPLHDESILGDLEDPTPTEKKVAFGSVEIRHYPIILGDHPQATEGPPITIDWIPVSKRDMSVNEYEEERAMLRPRRENLAMSGAERADILHRLGLDVPQFLLPLEKDDDDDDDDCLEQWRPIRMPSKSLLHSHARQKPWVLKTVGGAQKGLLRKLNKAARAKREPCYD